MARKVLVIAEIREGNLRNVSLETLSAARKIADGGQVVAVVFGSKASQHVSVLGHYGADQVYAVTNRQFDQYTSEAYAQGVWEVVRQVQPDVILLGHTGMGKDLAPRLAERLGMGLVSDVIDISADGEEIIFTRPIYAGKAFQKRKFAEGKMFATIRPNNIAMAEANTAKAAELVELAPEIKDPLCIVKDVVRKSVGKTDLTEAKIVVSGGRGVKSAEGFKLLYELAEVLGGAVGASRGACDAGYCDYALQVGQTGKVVTPDLYIACGISGAIQHLAGMSNSKVIVAINKDPEAPIFSIADYGIVGDLFEVVPLLTQEFRNVLQNASA